MQRKARPRQRQDNAQVAKIQRGGLEDRLHERDVHQRELRHGRDRDGRDEHLVLEEPAPDAEVLNRQDEVHEDETCEGLAGWGAMRRRGGRGEIHTIVCSLRDIFSSSSANMYTKSVTMTITDA